MLDALMDSIIHGNPPLILTPALVLTAWLIRAAIRRRVRIKLIVYGAIEALIGAVLVGLMLTHILGVVVRRVQLKEEMWVRFEPHVRLAGVPYDFRIYSLVLFGLLGVWAGINYVRAGRRMTRGDAEACATWPGHQWRWRCW